MSDKQRNPKLEIETNIPVVVTIGKMFYKGENSYGEFFGYNLTHNGSEYTFFASPFVHERFESFGQGATLNVVKRQKAGDRNATWEISEVNGAPKGAAKALQTVYDRAKPFDRVSYREQRVARMAEALDDAAKVIERIGEGDCKFEDIRSIAISFVIDELRQGIPIDEPEAKSGPDFNIPGLLETIKGELNAVAIGTPDEDKATRAKLVKESFGVDSWQAVTQLSGEDLVSGLATLKDKISDLVPF